MGSLHLDVRRLLADRHGPEAAALFRTLAAFVERRVGYLSRTRCRDLLAEADQEEILGEVLFTLMEGALGRFRGETTAELQAFVRTVADRTTLRRAQLRLRERETVDDLHGVHWTPTAPAPDEAVELWVDSPLDLADRTFLSDLLHAGSQADLARKSGVSRAAVSQRLTRIRDRIARLPQSQRDAHDAWLEHTATAAVAGDAPS